MPRRLWRQREQRHDHPAGAGTGGASFISASNGAAITIDDDLSLVANGIGGSSFTASAAGAGLGGTLNIVASGGNVSLAGVSGELTGQGGFEFSEWRAGAGTGGQAFFNANAAGSTLAIAASSTSTRTDLAAEAIPPQWVVSGAAVRSGSATAPASLRPIRSRLSPMAMAAMD